MLAREQFQQIVSDLDGPLSALEAYQLYEIAMQSGKESYLVEVGPTTGQITCIFALACRETSRKVLSIVHPAVYEVGSMPAMCYWEWHRAVLRKHFCPQVEVLDEGSRLLAPRLQKAAVVAKISDPLMRGLPCPSLDAIVSKSPRDVKLVTLEAPHG